MPLKAMKPQVTKVQINLDSYRPEGAKSWGLPPWGQLLSQGGMPLCASVANHLMSIETAFMISRKLALIVSAEHGFCEALKRQEKPSQSPVGLGR